MVIAGIVAVVILGIAILVILYWSLLEAMYPEVVTTEEIHTVSTGDIWKLRLCRYRKGLSESEPVLFVHGLNANQHNFTIPQGNSLADSLVKRGYDCWAVDLRGTRSSEPPFERHHNDATIDDFLLHDLPAVIHYIRKKTGFSKVHWVGHSLGGMLLYAYVQEFGDDTIASGTTLGSPIGFKKTRIWAPNSLLFLVRTFPHTLGNMLRGAMPIWFSLGIPTRFFPANMRNFHPEVSVGELFNLIEDPLPDVHDELVFWAKHQVWLMKDDELDVAAGLNRLRFPLLAMYGSKDPFIELESAEAFINGLPHDDKKMVVLSKENGCEEDYNHCEMPFSKQAESEVYATVATWISAHPSRERVAFSEVGEDQPPDFRPPLNDAERAAILSGDSYVAAAEADSLESVEDGASEVEPTPPAPETSEVASTGADTGQAAPAKKRAAKKTSARKPAAKKTSAKKKPAAKKAPAKKKAAAKKTPAKKAVAKKAAAKKTSAKKPAAKKAATKKAPAKKTAAKKKAAASETPRLVRRALEDASDIIDNLD